MAHTDPIKLSGIPGNLLPRNITGPIFEKSVEQSAVMALSRRVPLSMDATTSVPVPLDVPTADWVDEAGRKPLSSGGVGLKTMSGKKVAVLIPVSEEVARTNAAGLYAQLRNDLPTAFARAFDMAAIHGKTMKGATGPFADYLMATDKTQEIGTSSQATGGIWADLVKAQQKVVNDDWDFTGWVADRRLQPLLSLAVDLQGRPLLVDAINNPGVAMAGSLAGYPAAWSRAVSGKLRRQAGSTDTKLRAIGGDWSQTAYGVGMDITIKVSTEATYIDEDGGVHSAFQENLVLLLAEAYYGFVLGDSDAFVAVTDAT